MKYRDKDEAIVVLRQAVETRLGFGVNTPSEFAVLSQQIRQSTGKSISASTLMRIWGYVSDNVQPHTTTLNLLARYASYHDFASFCADSDENGSDDVLAPRINPATDLEPRDLVLIRWSGNHEILVRHLGDAQFVIVRCQNTKLCVGDTFNCHLIIQGSPAYLDNLVHLASSPSCYIIGKGHGVHYEIIEN